MSKLPINKKLNPIKQTNDSHSATKPMNKNNKDDIKNFIDAEISKFQLKKQVENKNFNSSLADDQSTSKSSSLMKENMKKIKDLNSQAKISELGKGEEMFKTSHTKFTAFKIDGKNMNIKVAEDTFNSSSNDFLKNTGGNNNSNKTKNPFTMKKFENVNDNNILKQEIIQDLNRAVDPKKKANFELNINKETFSKNNTSSTQNIYVLPDRQYDTPISKDNKNAENEEEEYYEDFIDDEELKKLEDLNKQGSRIENKNVVKEEPKQNIAQPQEIKNNNSASKSKKGLVLERIKNLGIVLEEENFDNMFQYDYNEKNFSAVQNLAKGLFKHEITQTNEMESKAVETVAVEYKDSYAFTDDQYIEKTQDKKLNPTKEKVLSENNEENKEIKQSEDAAVDTANDIQSPTYQPLSFDTYKFFIKFAPFVEKILMNNINKYILQTPQESQDLKPFSKLDKEYIISNELINYVNVNEMSNNEVTFNTFLFFDTNPMLVGISISIRFYNESDTSPSFENIFDKSSSNSNVNLIVIYNLFTNKEETIFYSFSKVQHMALLGNGENVVLACNAERTIDIFDMKSMDEKYCQIFENKGKNPTFSGNENRSNSSLPFKLILPSVSSGQMFNSQMISMQKKIIDSSSSNSKTKTNKIFIIDSEGFLLIYENSVVLNLSDVSKFPLRKVLSVNLKTNLERLFSKSPDDQFLKCIEFKISQKYSNSFSEIIYILTNYGLAKVTIEGKDDISFNSVYSNNNEYNKISSFDVSDTGHLLFAFADYTIKIIDEFNFSNIFQASVSTLSHDTLIDKIVFANIICKNEKSRLIRKTLIANFYVITSKNEFIIFDLNQKNKAEIKKIKKKLELGQKKGLTKRNSLVKISDSLFTDYSNYILQSSNKEKKVEFYKLSLRKQFYDINNIKGINEKIIDKISK